MMISSRPVDLLLPKTGGGEQAIDEYAEAPLSRHGCLMIDACIYGLSGRCNHSRCKRDHPEQYGAQREDLVSDPVESQKNSPQRPPSPGQISLLPLTAKHSQLAPPDTDPEYVAHVWKEVRSYCASINTSPLHSPPRYENMAMVDSEPAPLGPGAYGIDVLDDFDREDFFKMLDSNLSKHIANHTRDTTSLDCGLKAWENESGTSRDLPKIPISTTASFEGTAKLAKNYITAVSSFVEFHAFIMKDIVPNAPFLLNRAFGRACESNHLNASRDKWKHICPMQSIQEQIKRPTTSSLLKFSEPTPSLTAPSISDPSVPGLGARPRRLGPTGDSTSRHRPTTSSSSARSSKTGPITLPQLRIPTSYLDKAYWIDVSVFLPHKDTAIESIILTTDPIPVFCEPDFEFRRGTSPYMTIVFDDTMGNNTSLADQDKARVLPKVAAYGAISLDNRLRIFKSASNRRANSSGPDSHHTSSQLLHFCVSVVGEYIRIYAFKLTESCTQGSETIVDDSRDWKDGRYKWNGCTMTRLLTARITMAEDLEKLDRYLKLIHRWGVELYVEGLRQDINTLIN